MQCPVACRKRRRAGWAELERALRVGLIRRLERSAGKMSEDRVAYPYPLTTLEDIRITARRLGLPFNESQLTRVHKALLNIEDSAARLRQGLHRNDEPAF